MGVKLEYLTLLLCVIPVMVTSISVLSNGNSPRTRMVGGMMVDSEKGFVPVTPEVETTTKSNYEKSRTININSTLSLNERYRRLIPYMTFYYANDLATPTTATKTHNVEVEKAEIVEASRIEHNQRTPKKIAYSSQRNIPRYQGNRLTQYNIASANPTKIFYKDGVAYYQNPNKATPNVNPLLSDVREYDLGRFNRPRSPVGFVSPTRKPYLNLYNEESPNIRYYLSEKEPSLNYKLVPYEQTPPIRVNSYEKVPSKVSHYEQVPSKISHYEQVPSKISHYEQLPRKVRPFEQVPVKINPFEQIPFKISPYEQAPIKVSYEQPPVKVNYEQSPVKVNYEQSPVKVNFEQSPVKVNYEQAVNINSYEQTPIKVIPYDQSPPPVKVPQYEQTFDPKPTLDENYEAKKPVLVSVLVPTELYDKPRPVQTSFIYDNGEQQLRKQPSIVSESYYEKQGSQKLITEPVVESGFQPIAAPVGYSTEKSIHKISPETPITHYDIEDGDEKPQAVETDSVEREPEINPKYYQYVVDQPKPKPTPQTQSNTPNLATLLNSLQINKSIPKPLTKDNVGSSIRTLLQVLNNLKTTQQHNKNPALSTPKPFVPKKILVKVPKHPELLIPANLAGQPGLQDELLAEVELPSQHLDDHSNHGSTSQQFPLPTNSDDEGGTPGRPGIDYPVLSTIPQTSFDCKTQRYKGFFADTETRCQVWHYCDLNGGQASFLCPNGTIFSQAGLTCDWWFNVRCSSTPQLYVLNESLYKFILPHSPKFPEDYSGPLVDKYLTLKFKEMEEEFKKNKNKNAVEQSNEEEDSNESSEDDKDFSGEHDKRQLHDLSEASVIVESPGTSGKVQRLQDE